MGKEQEKKKKKTTQVVKNENQPKVEKINKQNNNSNKKTETKKKTENKPNNKQTNIKKADNVKKNTGEKNNKKENIAENKEEKIVQAKKNLVNDKKEGKTKKGIAEEKVQKKENKQVVANPQKEENKKKEDKKEILSNHKKENDELNKQEDGKKADNSSFEQVEYKPKKKRTKLKIFFIIIMLILLIILGLLTIPAIIARNSEKISTGVLINDIAVDNISYEEAKDKLAKEAEKITTSDIKLVIGEYENSIDLSQIGAKYDIDKAVQEAHNIGRTSNVFKGSLDIFKTKFSGKNIDLDVTFDDDAVNSLFNSISKEIPGHIIGWSYSVDNKTHTLTMTEGKRGIKIDKDETLRKMKEAMLSSLKGEKIDTIELVTIEADPDPIDVDKIHEEVFREPKNAYVTKDPFGVFVHVDGIDFNVDEVKKLVAKGKKEYTIELTVTEPEITTKELGQEAFPDIIGKTYKTTYSMGDVNRNTNIELAAKNVNGIILMPGETFSYNGILGDTTADKGYKPGGAFLNGEVVQSYGGGICQVSSTIYNAVLYADLEIVERCNHTFLTGYVPAGLDATVAYGYIDFKFKNNREYPIKLVVTAKNGVVSATIRGVKEKDDVDVELKSVVTSYIAPQVKYQDTNTMKKGTEVIKQSGSSGCRCTVYITKYKDGKQVSNDVYNDVYSAQPKIVLRGTKK